jgi:hypothetical protein
MRAWLLSLLGAVSLLGLAGTSPPPDTSPAAIIQNSVAAMAAIPPSDSQAVGSIQIVAGSETDSGTIQILTRGFSQTSERVTTSNTSRAVVYSQGLASETDNGTLQPLPTELALTTQSTDFPLPFLVAALNNPDMTFQFIGQETLIDRTVNHVRFWNTFASNSSLQPLAAFTTVDLWADAASGLPAKLSYVRRAAGGSAPRIPVETYYSDYRNVGGVLYPFLIQRSFDGTPWETITIQNVSLNVGLTDSSFPVQ